MGKNQGPNEDSSSGEDPTDISNHLSENLIGGSSFSPSSPASDRSHSATGTDSQKESLSSIPMEQWDDQYSTAFFNLTGGSTYEESDGDSGDFVVIQESSGSGSSFSSSSGEILKSLEAPKWIGPYKVINKVGEGGMGIVYLAQQLTPVQRMVAIKVVKAGMDTLQVIARFEKETHAISRMSHNGIAKILDAGATEFGRPFFVMEFVDGISITKFCERKKYSIRERVKLFLDVCRPVHHAHQKEVIHRDLKPSNILVSEVDEVNVKIIDFGLAKAAGHHWMEDSFRTAHGQLIGTLEYMSPEQASSHEKQIDHRSDVYSLGVILYLLLSGSTPLIRSQIKDVGLMEVLDRIRNDEPEVPSQRFRNSNNEILASHRSGTLRQVYRSIKGDLDWIVMRAISKNPSDRYESAEDLMLDLENYLADRPVNARPPSFCYKVSKAISKNRFACLAIGSFVLLLLTGLAATSYVAVLARQNEARTMSLLEKVQLQERRTKKALDLANLQMSLAEEATKQAEVEKAKAIEALKIAENSKTEADAQKKRSDDLLHLFTESFQNFDPGKGKGHELLASDAIRLAYKNAETRFEKNSITKADILRTLSWTFLGLGNYPLGVETGKESHRIYSLTFGENDSKSIDAQLAVFWNLHGSEAFEESFPVAEGLKTKVAKVLEPNDPLALRCGEAYAIALHAKGESELAILSLLKIIGRRSSASLPDRVSTWKSMGFLADVYRETKKPEEAISLLNEIFPLQERTLGLRHRDTIQTMNRLGECFMDAGENHQAFEILKEANEVASLSFGLHHPLRMETKLKFAIANRLTGKILESKKLLMEVKKELETGPHFLSTFGFRVWLNLGHVLLEDSKFPESKEAFSRAAQLADQKHGHQSFSSWEARVALANAARLCEDFQEVVNVLKQALDQSFAMNRVNPIVREKLRLNYAEGLLEIGQLKASLENFQAVVDRSENEDEEKWRRLLAAAQFGASKGHFYAKDLNGALGRVGDAVAIWQSLSESAGQEFSIDDMGQLAACYQLEAEIHLEKKDESKAITLLEKTIETRGQILKRKEGRTAENALKLSKSLQTIAFLMASGDDVKKFITIVDSGKIALEVLEERRKEVGIGPVLQAKEVLGNIQILADDLTGGATHLMQCEETYFNRFNFTEEGLGDLWKADSISRTLSFAFLAEYDVKSFHQSVDRSIKYLIAAELFVESDQGQRARLLSRCKEIKQLITKLKKKDRSADSLRRISELEQRLSPALTPRQAI